MTVDLPVVAPWIDGKLVEGSAARRGDVFDPAAGRQQLYLALRLEFA